MARRSHLLVSLSCILLSGTAASKDAGMANSQGLPMESQAEIMQDMEKETAAMQKSMDLGMQAFDPSAPAAGSHSLSAQTAGGGGSTGQIIGAIFNDMEQQMDDMTAMMNGTVADMMTPGMPMVKGANDSVFESQVVKVVDGKVVENTTIEKDYNNGKLVKSVKDKMDGARGDISKVAQPLVSDARQNMIEPTGPRIVADSGYRNMVDSTGSQVPAVRDASPGTWLLGFIVGAGIIGTGVFLVGKELNRRPLQREMNGLLPDSLE